MIGTSGKDEKEEEEEEEEKNGLFFFAPLRARARQLFLQFVFFTKWEKM